jgi:transposase InsO family protein
MQVHSNATTNKKQRERIIGSPKTCRALAGEMAVSLGTVNRWKHRDSPQDRSCRPHTVKYAFDAGEQAMILALRRQGLPIDDLVDLVRQPLPEATRSSVYRLLKRSGVSRLPRKEEQETGQGEGPQSDRHGQFKDYGPGFLHVDCFYLPKLEGQKRYCFVAIDRATRLSYLAVYEHKDKEAATDFLGKCLAFFPFKVGKVLTDNGREFTLHGFRNRYGTQVRTTHPFDAVCEALGIEHRLTRPYTPKTNGMAERMNGLIRSNRPAIPRRRRPRRTATRRFRRCSPTYTGGSCVTTSVARTGGSEARRPTRRVWLGSPSSRNYSPRSRPRSSFTVHNLVKLDT